LSPLGYVDGHIVPLPKLTKTIGKAPATSARKNGQGLLGETGFCGLDASLEIVLLRSCMDLGPKKRRIIKPNDEKSLALIRNARRRELP
jgi:hypothetical protein